MSISRFGISEALLIAALPAAGYWLGFLYEVGYCTYFSIPLAFIDVGWTVLLTAIVAVLLAIVWLVPLVEVASSLIAVIDSRALKFIVIRHLLMLAFLIAFALVLRWKLATILVVVALFMLPWLFADFVTPLIKQRAVAGYVNKVIAEYEADLAHVTVTDRLANIVGDPVFLGMLAVLAISGLSYFAGGFSARSKTEFVVISGKPEYVVLKRQADYFVASELDRNAMVIRPSFKLFGVDDKLGVFSYEKLRDLRPADK